MHKPAGYFGYMVPKNIYCMLIIAYLISRSDHAHQEQHKVEGAVQHHRREQYLKNIHALVSHQHLKVINEGHSGRKQEISALYGLVRHNNSGKPHRHHFLA